VKTGKTTKWCRDEEEDSHSAHGKLTSTYIIYTNNLQHPHNSGVLC
jgi:hypothetical protein